MEFMTREAIQKKVPSIFGYAGKNMSEKYIFTPTSEVIDDMEKIGWVPTNISGIRPSRRDANTTKHVIRFADSKSDILINGSRPEICIINSHDGTSLLSAHLGYYRLVCANGLMVGTTVSSMRWKHNKLDFNEIKHLVILALDEFSILSTLVPKYETTYLNEIQQTQFASKVIEMVWNGQLFEPKLLLKPRRSIDVGSSLFTTMNVIQENVMAGGIRYALGDGRKNSVATTRAVKNIDKNISFNLGVWALMDMFYKTGKF